MDMLKNIDPCDLVILSTLAAICLSEGLTANELNVRGNFIVCVGGLMLTWAAQKQSLSETSDSSVSGELSITELEKTVKELQSRLEKLEGT